MGCFLNFRLNILIWENSPGLQALNFNFIHFHSFSNIHSLMNEYTFINHFTFRSSCKLSLFTYTFPIPKMKVCKMNEKYNNVWMSICSLVNEYLKMNGNIWKWKFRVWSPGLRSRIKVWLFAEKLPFSIFHFTGGGGFP